MLNENANENVALYKTNETVIVIITSDCESENEDGVFLNSDCE